MEIEYPGFGTIEVFGARYDHDVLLVDGKVQARDKGPSKALKSQGHTPLSAKEVIPLSKPMLIIGTGHSGRLPVFPAVSQVAAKAGVEVEMMPTGVACELLRKLDPQDANAILHVTC